MPALREQDFDKLASRVVDRFLGGKAKLADATAEEAMDAGLNPDQIERLTQAANTLTFLRMMDQRKQEKGEDLTQEFDPVDSRQVIRIVIDRSGVHVDPHAGDESPECCAPAAEEEHELPDEMTAAREGLPPSPEEDEEDSEDKDEDKDEDKGEGESEDDDAAPAKKSKKKEETPKEAMLRIHRMRKLAGILEDEYRQKEWEFEDTFQKLAARFKRTYPDITFDAFEKDALAEAEDEVGLNVLNLLRQDRKLAPLETKLAFEKMAALTDRHVSDESVELVLFEDLVKIARDADKTRRGLAWLRTQCA